MNNSNILSDFRALILKPSSVFRFFESYEKPNPWLVFKILWGFFLISILTHATLAYKSLGALESTQFNVNINGMELNSHDFPEMAWISEFLGFFKPVLTWVEIWQILLSPFFDLSKILSVAALTYVILDVFGAKPERVGFSKLFLILCLVNWLQIFEIFSGIFVLWIFILSVLAVEKIFLVSKTQAFFAVTASIWIVFAGIYLAGVAGVGGLIAFLI
jgi:hypothetical protein